MLPRILVFAGSNRSGAYSGKVAALAATVLAQHGADVTRISLADYALPIMDEDHEATHGIPDNALRLGRLIAAHDGLLIASPEYNASIPPLVKNTIDWVSRITKDRGKPMKPFAGRIAALCSSSPGNFAGIRGLYHLRAVAMKWRNMQRARQERAGTGAIRIAPADAKCAGTTSMVRVVKRDRLVAAGSGLGDGDRRFDSVGATWYCRDAR